VNAGRHLKAIGLLPGMVTLVIPAGIVASAGTDVGWGLDGAPAALPVVAGALLAAAGAALPWARQRAAWGLRGAVKAVAGKRYESVRRALIARR